MQVSSFRRSKCRLCSSNRVVKVVELAAVPLAEKYSFTKAEALGIPRYPLDLYYCHDCSHVQILDVIESEALWSDYTYHSSQTAGIVEHFKEVAAQLNDRLAPSSKGLVVDIGSNDGSLLRPFKEIGYSVLGVDPALEIASAATAAGIETIPKLFTTEVATNILKSHGKAAVVTAFNVFAHADNLGDMARAAEYLLADDGIFVFEVQYLVDIVNKMLLGTIFHEHMSHHSVGPMKKFLHQHGLELIDVERVSIQKGSIIGIAQRIGGPRSCSKSVAELISLEEQMKLNTPECMAPFNERLSLNKAKALALKKLWREKNLRVCGFGAARSGPTLLTEFGFGDRIEAIFDDHPQKVGRFSPGDGIPVVSTSELYVLRPDVTVILAWIHARAIVTKHQKYLDQGGSFVLCTPDLTVITGSNNPYT